MTAISKIQVSFGTLPRRCSPRWNPSEPLSHCLPRERHVGERLRNVRIVVPVAIPRPADAGVQHFAIAPQFLEARTIDSPDVAILRRHMPYIRKARQPPPRTRPPQRPAPCA